MYALLYRLVGLIVFIYVFFSNLYRENDSYYPEIEEIYPVADLEDGYWTKPYYDCGGGEIWMVTYSVPFFKMEDGPVFQ